MSISFQSQANLATYHTFGIDVSCDVLVEVNHIDDIKAVFQSAEWASKPKLILGKGSNVLFTEHYQGVVIVNRLMGKVIKETETDFHLHIAGGEDWPSLVEWTLDNGICGLENLAMIPGCAGSAPIQNIGAYGVEFKDCCEYVEYIDLQDFNFHRLSAQECEFGYRDSIFKQSLLGKVMIVAVGLKMSKQWQPNLSYGPLKAEQDSLKTAKDVFELVSAIRREKLPDPSQIGNAGSFFKNPIISKAHFEKLQSEHPELKGFESEGGMKIAAGWLIDRCGLKGFSQGGAQVHPKQALVLINSNGATHQDVLDLAWHVKQEVMKKFEVELFHEVRFFNATQETRLEQIKVK